MRKLAVGTAFAVLALASGASAQPQATAQGVLLSKNYRGVYRLGPKGPVHKLVGTDICPFAVAADGTAVGFLAANRCENSLLYLARGTTRVRLPQSDGGTQCAAFSADGSQVAYVSGRVVLTQPSPQLAYFRIEGTLWLADVAHPGQAQAIESGTFTTSECPLPAPTDRQFAYFIQTAPGEWRLRLYRNGGLATVVDDQTPVPSNHDRSFAWAPNGTLGFLRGDDLWVGHRQIASGLVGKLGPRPNIRYGKEIDFSADGRLVAVSLGDKTGIFRLSGRLIRVVPGHLLEWSGSQGVLTVGATGRAVIVLRRFPLAGSGRILARYFKLPVVCDPAGRWFAYPIAQTGQFVFRRADGTLLRIVRLNTIGVPLAAIDRSGRLSIPAGSY